ncbi:MAG: cell division protein FtsZ [Rhodospirillales bacterium]|nr:cell division protein FtsZ [Rhodospirillales bacterium]MCW8861519.1 cell division protein FtsZ [Rhodospirillales bacterium]MCW8951221.1 cell division protein FtsZ [Rhodospirillales bacterium]MCW8971313.1 cell division protein FtsZ [Rhodospirillales bacterium]
MSINLTIPGATPELKPKITVVGVGGAGGNAVNNMIEAGLEGVDFVVANTDAQALTMARTDHRVQLGLSMTHGLGAGSHPDVGRAAADEALEEITAMLSGSNMVFVAAGMGGGTGTGAAPVIARVAREQGILTVGVVTKPFQFEGSHRMRIADGGIEELQRYVDTLIIIPNQNLFRVANEKTTFADAFKMADDVLYSGVRSVTDLMVMPGLINLDFADVRAVMAEMGKAMMGTGEAEGDKRALEAAESAISNPLLEDTSIKGAHGVLINITGGPDMTLFEVDEAANRIRDEVDADAHIIFGSTFDPVLEGRIRVSVVATGIDSVAGVRPAPVVLDAFTGANAKPAPAKVPTPNATVAKPVPMPAVAAAVDAENGDEETTPVDDIFDAVMKATKAVKPEVEEATNETVAEIETEIREFFEDAVEDVAVAENDEEATDVALEAEVPSMGEPPAQPEEPFIPPMPAEVKATKAPTRDVDPFRATDMINGGDATQKAEEAKKAKKRAGGLFGLVTGRGDAPKKEPEMPVAAQPAQPKAVVEPMPTRQGEQLPLGPSASLGRSIVSEDEDELLEIPSFLRRQAN